jgi:hypothetical protein
VFADVVTAAETQMITNDMFQDSKWRPQHKQQGADKTTSAQSKLLQTLKIGEHL